MERRIKVIQLNYGDASPIYEQIKQRFKDLIVKGVLKENDKIPSVRELASHLAINPNTIQKAYKELELEGYIYSVKAKGCFVLQRSEALKKADSLKSLNDFKKTVDKLKLLGVDYEDALEILNKGFEKGE